MQDPTAGQKLFLSKSKSGSLRPSAMTYRYTKLDRSKKLIRLLSFQDLHHNRSRIHCRLDVYDLSDCPEFIALSYTWGESQSNQDVIIMEGKAFPVRHNLHSALSVLRGDAYDSYLGLALKELRRKEISSQKFLARLEAITPFERWPEVLGFLRRLPSWKQAWTWSRKDRKEVHSALFRCMTGQEPRSRTWHPKQKPSNTQQERHKYYWIDAICIDQEDVLERGHQVDMMSSIYSKATTVFAWLGPVSKNLEAAVKCEGDIARWWQMPPSDMRRAIQDLAQREYWTRMWIVQEFILPRRVILLVGHIKMTWKWLRWALTWDTLRLLPLIEEKSRWGLREAKDLTLAALLHDFGAGLCSDPRDRVYALLSLVQAPDHVRRRLPADYAITAQQLYCRVLEHGGGHESYAFPTKSLRDKLAQTLGVSCEEQVYTVN